MLLTVRAMFTLLSQVLSDGGRGAGELVTPLPLLALAVAQHIKNLLMLSPGPSRAILQPRTSREHQGGSSLHEPNLSQALIGAGKPEKQQKPLGKSLMPGDPSIGKTGLEKGYLLYALSIGLFPEWLH